MSICLKAWVLCEIADLSVAGEHMEPVDVLTISLFNSGSEKLHFKRFPDSHVKSVGANDFLRCFEFRNEKQAQTDLV